MGELRRDLGGYYAFGARSTECASAGTTICELGGTALGRTQGWLSGACSS
jgi:hypothetical protein